MPEAVEIPKTDLSGVLESIKQIQNTVDAIRIPEQKEVDLGMVLSKLDYAIKCAEDKDMTPEQIQPLSDLHNQLSDTIDQKQQKMDETLSIIQDSLMRVQEFFTKDMDELQAGIADLKKMIANISSAVLLKSPEEKESDEPEEINEPPETNEET